MKTIIVSAGESINAAIDRAAPGDRIAVQPGIYREKVTVDKPDLIIESVEKWQAIIDGGYSPGLFKPVNGKWVLPTVPKSGATWLPNREYGGLVEIAQPTVFRGFTVRNAAGQGIKFINETAPSGTVIDGCRMDFTYDGAIGAGGTTYRLKDIQITNNVITRSSVRLFDPLRDGGGPESVATTIKPLHCDDAYIAGNVVLWCFGEGISAARGSVRTVIERNVIGNCEHWHGGVQRGRLAIFRDNFIFHTGHPLMLNAKGELSDGIVIGDEGASASSGESYGAVITNNIVVNCGEGFGVRATGNYTTRMRDAVISHNLLWAGPDSKAAVDIETGKTATGAWRDHENNLFENNIAAGLAKTNRIQGVYFRHNGWTAAPPDGMQGPGDATLTAPSYMPVPVLPEFVLNAPECPVPTYEELRAMAELYRPQEGSPVIGAASDGSRVTAKGYDIAPPPVTTDFSGEERTQPADLGPLAFIAVEPPPPPPEPPPPAAHDLTLAYDPATRTATATCGGLTVNLVIDLPEPPPPPEPEPLPELMLAYDSPSGVITAACGEQVRRALVTAYTNVFVSVQDMESEL